MKGEGSSTSDLNVINENIQEFGETKEHNSQDIACLLDVPWLSCLGGE